MCGRKELHSKLYREHSRPVRPEAGTAIAPATGLYREGTATMSDSDTELGLRRRITRRDLIHGMGAVAGASLLPGKALAGTALNMEVALAPYPPALTGLRGNHPGARILILDNHDDFGGHAKRNELYSNGTKLIGYGGSQTLQEPSSYPAPAKELLRDLNVDLTRFDSAYDQDFYRRNKLAPGIFFNREQWRQDALVPCDLGTLYDG